MNFIYTAADALPAALCEEAIARFEAHPGKGPGVTTAGKAPGRKTSIDLTIDDYRDLQDLHQRLLNACLEDLTDYFVRSPFVGSVTPVVRLGGPGSPEVELTMDNVASVNRDTVKMLVRQIFRCGTVNIQKYPAGQGGYPHWHCETSPDPTMEALHRVVLWIYYLNHVEVGGETEFWFQQRAIRPRRGTVVIAPAGFTHTHRGNVPLSGDKYIMTSWMLYQRADRPA
jgi:hypothetical protein